MWGPSTSASAMMMLPVAQLGEVELVSYSRPEGRYDREKLVVAACFGMFSIMRDMHISKNTLPLKMYKLSTYSFRHEQKGEVIGLKRLRAFTMPDMHSLCTDMPEAMKCFEEQLAIGWQTGGTSRQNSSRLSGAPGSSTKRTRRGSGRS